MPTLVAMNHSLTQSLISLVALIISIASAYFTWQQLEISRTHNRLSVEPIVHVTPYAEGKQGRNGLYVSNAGLGPAIIRSFSAKAAGISAAGFDSDRWPEILTSAGVTEKCFATGWPRANSALKPGEELPLFYVTKAEGMDVCYTQMIKLMGGTGIEVTVHYESIYKEEKSETSTTKVQSRIIDTLYRALFN
jgi:hypothetical protein